MTLPNWWEVVTPHRDIREGKMSEAIFAADLANVFYSEAPLEYQDPYTFFQRTYITNGLKNLLESVFSRLNNGKGNPVIQLQTPFGGGKTHALLALYHAVKNWEKVKHLDIFSKLPQPKNAKVVVFVGTYPDPVKGRTPWGEIAYQLGVYDKVREHDEKRRSPGRKILNQVLGDDPVLILFDELVEYVVKARDFEDQILAFSQELTETVNSKNNCCLVCTLPSSVPYGETGERALNRLQRIFGRLETIYTPVEGVEIYEIIRKRLFDDFGDEKIRREVAQRYFNLYQSIDVPPEVKEISYRDKIEHAYPFHPELIDVLYERWGSFPTFQRTRGVLRLLAEVVADLYKRRVPSPLIQSSLVNLENQEIRSEFIKHIGNEYESVIASDIAGKNAKAPRIDKEMGSEYEKYRIASGIATSVFLYSFSGGEKKETTLPRIRVALLREGVPHTIVGDAIAKLEEELWFFHSEKKRYYFNNQPNLNRMILDKEETISYEKIREKLKELTQKCSGKSLEVYLWPENSSDIPDNKSLKLAILSPEFTYNSQKGENLVIEFFEKCGTGFRIYKNTLFIVAMDEVQSAALLRSLKRFLALSDLQSEKSLEKLTKESQDELRKKFKEAEKEVPFAILSAYRYLAMLEKDEVSWKDMGIPTSGETTIISERVKQYLKSQERILSRLTPKYIIDKTFAEDESEKTLRDIYELFLKVPGMPIPENEDVLFEAIREGVKNGFMGLREGDKVYYKQEVAPTMDSIVLRGELEKIEEEEKEDKKDRGEVKDTVKPYEKVHKVKKLTIRAKIPWDKLSEIIKGVIGPLRKEDAMIDLTMEIRANSEEGLDRNTLDNKVRETLQQIGANIEKWDEE